MSNFALTDSDGYIVAFYDNILIPDVPTGAFSITDAIWGEWKNNVNGLRWDGTTLVQGSRPQAPPIQQESENRPIGHVTVDFGITTTLSGTYSVLPSAMAEMNMIENYVNKNGAFPPKNSETLDWLDVEGKIHTFPNIEIFKMWSSVMLDHAIELKSGRTVPLPAVTLDL